MNLSFLKNVIIISCLMISSCKKEEMFEVNLTIKEHKFEPAIIYVPEMKKIKIYITNMDDTAEEFESLSLKRERIIPAKGKAIITLAPLKKGEFEFFGEFHQDTAQGKIIVKDNE
jgi:hypothetical protein